MKQKRRLNRALLDLWLDANGPDAVARLALKAQVSTSLINQIRSKLSAPTKTITQEALCKAIGSNVDELFPKEN